MQYQDDIRLELQGIEWKHGKDPVTIIIEAGVGRRNADLDNIFKPLLDTLQWIFDDFDDKMVYRIEADKKVMGKGKEYIHVQILQNELP